MTSHDSPELQRVLDDADEQDRISRSTRKSEQDAEDRVSIRQALAAAQIL